MEPCGVLWMPDLEIGDLNSERERFVACLRIYSAMRWPSESTDDAHRRNELLLVVAGESAELCSNNDDEEGWNYFDSIYQAMGARSALVRARSWDEIWSDVQSGSRDWFVVNFVLTSLFALSHSDAKKAQPASLNKAFELATARWEEWDGAPWRVHKRRQRSAARAIWERHRPAAHLCCGFAQWHLTRYREDRKDSERDLAGVLEEVLAIADSALAWGAGFVLPGTRDGRTALDPDRAWKPTLGRAWSPDHGWRRISLSETELKALRQYKA